MMKQGIGRQWHLGLMVILALGLVACGGGGGSGDDGVGTSAAKADLSETSVQSAVDNIDSYVPGCEAVGATPLAFADPSAASGAIIELVDLFRLAAERATDEADVRTLALTAIGGQTLEGDCGGTAEISSNHESGTTTFSVSFNNFCMEDSESSSGQTELAGNLTLKEIGTPTDFGPSISRVTAAAPSLTVVSDGETTTLSLGELSYNYGTPGVTPGTPTQASPDRITIDRVTIDYVSQDKRHSLSNLSANTWEAGTDMVVDIASGRYDTTSSGYVDISTDSPLVLDIDGVLTGGSLNLSGADGTVTITPSPAGVDIFDVAVDGQSLDTAVDCSSGGGLLSQLLL